MSDHRTQAQLDAIATTPKTPMETLVFVQRKFLDVLAERDRLRAQLADSARANLMQAENHTVYSRELSIMQNQLVAVLTGDPLPPNPNSQVEDVWETVQGLRAQLAEAQSARDHLSSRLTAVECALSQRLALRREIETALGITPEMTNDESLAAGLMPLAAQALRELDARHCENCADWSEDEATFVHNKWHPPCESALGGLVNVLLPADFVCRHWRKKEA